MGYNFSSDPQLSYGLRLTADFGRKESRSDDLRGMGDIKPRPEWGGFLNYAVTREFSASAALRNGTGTDQKGLVVDLGVSYCTEIAPDLRLGFSTGLKVANDRYLQTYFGVTAQQAASSGYAAYSPAIGLRAGVGLNYGLAPRMMLTTAVSASTLAGDAKSSPLVRKKSRASAVVALSRAF